VKNKIEDLRNHLFETLEDLRDKEKPMDIERAKAIAGVAQVIVDSAKAENEFIKITGGEGSGFIPDVDRRIAPPQPRLLNGTQR
jgi:hypothetical protein